MKKAKLLLFIALFLSALVISLPICFASELNLVYDNNGNLLSGDGYNRTYNSLNQLSKVYNETGTLLQEYKYHPTEERVHVKITYNEDGSNETVIYISKTFVRIINSSGTYDYTYVYQDGILVGQINPDGSKIYIHPDHLGSSTVVTDESGNVLENTTYSPFGEVLTGGTESRYDYEGQEYDSVVGDYDFNFRKYRADLGIFTQPDSLIPNVYGPQSLNRYMFERGNPYKNKDETGHFWQPLVIGAIAVFLWGDTASYGVMTLGYSYMAIRSESDKSYYWNKAGECLGKTVMSAVPTELVALPSGWSDLLSKDYEEFGEDWKDVHKKDKDVGIDPNLVNTNNRMNAITTTDTSNTGNPPTKLQYGTLSGTSKDGRDYTGTYRDSRGTVRLTGSGKIAVWSKTGKLKNN